MKERVTVQIAVDVEYDETREGAKEYVMEECVNLRRSMFGGGTTGTFSVRVVEGSGRVISVSPC